MDIMLAHKKYTFKEFGTFRMEITAQSLLDIVQRQLKRYADVLREADTSEDFDASTNAIEVQEKAIDDAYKRFHAAAFTKPFEGNYFEILEEEFRAMVASFFGGLGARTTKS